MKLTKQQQYENARDWIANSSEPLQPNEKVDRIQLKEQMQYTVAENEDIEAIAEIIERLSNRRKSELQA